VIECARGLTQFGRAADADRDARAVIAGFDLACGGAQPGQILQIDFQQYMRQPGEQGESGGKQDEQAGAEMPEKILIGMGRRLDHQAAIGGATDGKGCLHDRNRQVGQRGKPAGTAGTVRRRFLAQDEAVGRGVFHVVQVALGNRGFQLRLQGTVIAHDSRVGHRPRQRHKLCRCLNAQRVVGVLAGDLQRLLPRQGEHRNQDEQERAHDAALCAEMRQSQAFYKEGITGRGMDAHTQGIGSKCHF